MFKKTLMMTILVLIGLTGWTTILHADEEQEIGIKVGQIAPNFKLTDLTGKEIQLTDFRGTKVMVNFWATWCPPCKLEMPAMQAVHERDVVQILAVNVTGAEASLKQVRSFVEEHKLTFPILLDTQMDVSKMYRIRPIPTTFFIDEEGIIRNIYYGPLHQDRMLQYLDLHT